jgi:catechol 2,3-dioxygenase-like lactoylglutathione lyase family enzyme
MKLNHLNLTVSNVPETHRFLEKHFGFKGYGAVASAPAAFRVRVWQVMSRGQGLGARRSPPEGANDSRRIQ